MFGVLAGSATLTGGPATGLAFAPLFEQAGLVGAESIAITSAMAGIVCGGIVGGPAITLLIRRLRLQPGKDQATTVPAAVAEELDIAVGDGVVVDTEAAREFNALKSIVVILLAMWVGRSEEHKSELQSLMRTSYVVLGLKKKKQEYDYGTTL